MFRRALTATLAAIALASSGMVVSPTSADGGGSLSSPDVVLFDCVDQPLAYSLDLPDDTTYWFLHLTLTYPSGYERYISISSPEGSELAPHSGTTAFILCPSDGMGTLTLNATVDYSEYGNQSTTTMPESSFQARRPVERTTAHFAMEPHWARYVKGLTVHTLTTVEQPDGSYLPVNKTEVYLQRMTGSGWATLERRRVKTRGDGTGVTKFEWPLDTKGRLRVTSANIYYGADVEWTYSAPFTVEVPPGPNPFPRAQGWPHQRDRAKFHITRDGHAYFWTTLPRKDAVSVVFDTGSPVQPDAIQFLGEADKPARAKFTKCGVRSHVIIFGPAGMDQRTLPAWPCKYARETGQARP